ncbi:MAG: 3-oxoacyl-ACP reductase family protein [Pseudomonadota bacterium]
MTQTLNAQTNNSSKTNLAGKTALVTGGSRGIGAAIARKLATDGAAVAITYSSSAQQAEQLVADIRATGGKALAIRADAQDADAVRQAVAKTIAEFGTLDILVNNAGALVAGDIADISMEDYQRLIAVNVTGVFVASQEAQRHMKEGGRIINIGSVNSDYVPVPGLSLYALTKGAVASFTRGLARDLGARGITVNNVQPGPVDTEMNPANSAFADTMRGYMATGKYGTGVQIASLVAYLASEDAAFITGANLKADGGFDA